VLEAGRAGSIVTSLNAKATCRRPLAGKFVETSQSPRTRLKHSRVKGIAEWNGAECFSCGCL